MKSIFPILFSLPSLLCPPQVATEVKATVEAREYAPGEVLLVSVENCDPKKPPRGTFLKKEFDFFAAPSGEMLGLASIDLDAPLGAVSLQVEGKTKEGKSFTWSQEIQIQKKEFPIVELKVDDSYVNIKKKDLERANREAKELKAIFRKSTPELFMEGAFSEPVPGAKAARFGERRVFNKQPRAPHSGADLAATIGTPVQAPQRGKVVLTEDTFFAGNLIVLDHGYGLYTSYAHLSKMLVKPGDVVNKGQVIGEVGKTGRVTGPHLHWGVKLHDDRIDPFSLTSLDLDRRLKPSP